jgi:hypothetical protein
LNLFSLKKINASLVGNIHRGQPPKQNKFHLTQKLVNTFVRLGLYSLAAFTISLGVDQITRRTEGNLIRLTHFDMLDRFRALWKCWIIFDRLARVMGPVPDFY